MSEVLIKRDRAKAIAEAFAGKRIIVLGDLMLDEFIWGRVRRISPEAPVPVVEVERQTLALGGAGNVAANLVARGRQPVAVSAPNHQEAAEAAGLAIEDEASLIEAGRPLLGAIDCRALLITRGEE